MKIGQIKQNDLKKNSNQKFKLIHTSFVSSTKNQYDKPNESKLLQESKNYYKGIQNSSQMYRKY